MGVTKHLEPFKNLLTQGMVKGKSYKVKKTGQYLHRDNVDFSGMGISTQDEECILRLYFFCNIVPCGLQIL